MVNSAEWTESNYAMKCGTVAWFVAASPRDLRGSRSGIARTVLRHVTPCRWASTSDVSSHRSAL